MPRPTYTSEAQKAAQQAVLQRADNRIQAPENMQGITRPPGVDSESPGSVTRDELVAGRPGGKISQDTPVDVRNSDLQAQNVDAPLPQGETPTNTRREIAMGMAREDDLDQYEDRRAKNSQESEDEYGGDYQPAYEGLDLLSRYIKMDNIADDLEDETLMRIGKTVVEEYEIDERSRSDWKEQVKKALELARQIATKKSKPWPGASNIKYPLITVAALQFNARAYSAIVAQPELVKAKVNGYDPDGRKQSQAERVSKAMSWQCLEQMENWAEETDKLLMILPIVGMHLKKSYFNPRLGRNVSEGVLAEDCVWNYKAKDFNTCPRHTHILTQYPYEIWEQQASGMYLDVDLGPSTEEETQDPDAPHTFLEQHRLWDLDNDGYPEPYVVTVHKETQRVVRIVARYTEGDVKVKQGKVVRIEPMQHFTKFGFLPNPDGSSYDIGFGLLMGPLNIAVNRSLNMLFDAGHLQNAGGGFLGKGLRMKGGSVSVMPGYYAPVDSSGQTLRDNIVPHNHPGPSTVLFQLLGFLVEAANDIGSIKDVLTGEQNQANVPASTTLALIEQGLKVQTTINQRVHRALKREFKLLFKLNGLYMEPITYITFLDADTPQPVLLQDFKSDSLDISVGSDPKMMTDMQEITRAQAILPFAQDPDFDGWKIKSRYLKALGIQDVEQLRADPKAKQAMAMQQMQMMMAQMQNAHDEAQAKLIKAKSGALKDRTGAILDLAKAEEVNTTLQNEVAYYQDMVNKMSQVIEVMSDARSAINRGGVPQLEAGSQNPQGAAVSGGLPQQPAGNMG